MASSQHTMPDPPGGRAEASSRTSPALAELLLDQRRRWQLGDTMRVEAYVKLHPELLSHKEAILDLVYNEVILRERRGEKPDVQEYIARFPELGDALRVQFAMDREFHDGSAVTEFAGDASAVEPASASLPPAPPGYQILQVLGRGGMGVVYQAWQIGLNRAAALKMVLAGAHAGPQELARFRNEAEAVARLQHPNIVQIYEVGTEDGLSFLALEFVDGGSLAKRLSGTPLPARQAAELAQTLARAVHYAHERGIVHRDLTPSNVLLTRDGVPKITDFGLAKILVGGVVGQTQTGAILGTPSYMSPEQAAGQARTVGPATDIYALGAILYEMLTGRAPFKAETALDTILQVAHNEPVPPRELQPNAPQDLETICLKCLRKEPARRYASAAELGDDLRRYLGDQPIQARPAGRFERAWRWGRRNPVIATLLSSIALLLVVIAVGASFGLVLLQRELARTEDAEREGKHKLLQFHLERARAATLSRQSDHQSRSLKDLAEAARLTRELDVTSAHVLELRNAAIACLASPELRLVKTQELGAVADTGGHAFDSKLERYVHGDPQHRLVIRRVEDNAVLQTLPPPPDTRFWYMHAMFSPDDRLLLAVYSLYGPQAKCVLWDLAANQQLRTFVSTGQPAFSPDSGTLAAPLEDGSIGLFEAASGEEPEHIGKGIPGGRLSFDPSGRRLCCAEKGLQILDARTGAVRWKLPHEVPVSSSAWSGDGRWLAAGCEDRRIYVYDTAERQLHSVLTGHENTVIHLQFSPASSLLASYSWDDTTRLWDPIGGRELLSGVGAFVRFSQDGRRLGFVQRPRFGVWELTDAAVCRTLHQGSSGNRTRWNPHVGPFMVDFSRDGRLLASSAGDGVRVWDAAHARQLAHLRTGFAQTVQFNPQDDSLLTYGTGGLLLWPITPANHTDANRLRIGPPATLHEEGNLEWAKAAWAGDGRRVAFADHMHRAVLALSLDNPNERRVLPARFSTSSLATSPDGKWVAVVGWKEDRVTVWEVATRRTIDIRVASPDANPRSIAFSPDGEWLVVSTERGYEWRRVGAWTAGPTIGKETGAANTETSLAGMSPLAFSRDGRTLAVTPTPQTIQLVDPASGRELATLSAPDRRLISWLCFSPDGSQLAAATNDDLIQLWDLRALRRRLAELGLDWEPAYQSTAGADQPRPVQAFVQYPPFDARANLDKANQVLAGDPKHVQALWIRAQAYAVLNEMEKALADADELLRMLPADHKLRGELSLARTGWQLWFDAQKALRRSADGGRQEKKP